MGFGLRVDRAVDFRHPQADGVVRENGHGQAVLVAVKSALGLTDDDGVETAVRVGENVKKLGGGV